MSASEQDQRNKEDIASPDSGGIGADEWVSQFGERFQGAAGIQGALADLWYRVPRLGRIALAFLVISLVPTITGTELVLGALDISNNAFILRIGVRFLTFAILAIGLNVVVGYAGLLDLGYVAYMGLAGYLYAYMSSDFVQIGDFIPNGLAVPSIVSVPLIMLIVAAFGWLIGSASLRLAGDYFAIVTLGFGLVFVQVVLTATRVSFPWAERPVDLTRGPNGINRLDNISLFGFEFQTTEHYFYLMLVLLFLVYFLIDNLNRSRTGRSWRAIRDDELAAEVMSVPTRRMKVLAVIIGAAIAALAGSVDAAFQTNVVPSPRYSAQTLINLYAMVVLGGLGSLPGAVIGAFIFSVLPELLRNIQLAGFLFYGVGLLLLLVYLRPKRFVLFLGGTVVAGFIFKAAVGAFAPQWDAGFPEAGSLINQYVQGWLIIPEDFRLVGNIATWLVIATGFASIVLKGGLRWIVLGLTIYLAAMAWETRLAIEPGPTRILFIGVSLVGLMIFRPQGLLGKPEVRIV